MIPTMASDPIPEAAMHRNGSATDSDDDDDDDVLDVEGSVALSNPASRKNDFGTTELESEERKTLAKEENKAVARIRIVVYLVVLFVAISVSLAVYFYTKNDQQEDFETQFGAFAAKVSESFYDSVERKLGAINTMSTTITSYAINTGATFPNVTLPDFELQGANTRIQAEGVILYFSPLVTDETRAGWEEYAAAKRGWIMDAFAKELQWKGMQDAKFGFGTNDQTTTEDKEQDKGNGRKLQDAERPEQITFEDGFNFFINDGNDPMPFESGPFLPLWQLTPVLPVLQYLNYDLSTHVAVSSSLHDAISSAQVVMGQAHDLKDPEDTENESESLYNAFLMTGQYRHDTELYEGDPTTNIIYPVFDSFGPNRTLAGVLMTSMYWRLNFATVLPETAKGVICVMENSLSQSFTYRLDGPKVTFLGPGDRHDPKYDYMAVTEDVVDLLRARAGPENEGFDAADLNTEHCRYKLHVYPSQDTEAEYVNNEPLMYTLLVAGIFLVTSLIFVLYDWLVARRQRIVMTKAVQSSAIVSSLYPKQVRYRLFEEGKGNASKTSDAWKASPAANGDLMDISSYNPGHARSDRPIADSYEACTVLFADLAGFTKFSASRTPEDVFFLLETLYQAFDAIAVRRKVFKVETIGDCYVAVTGLPDPQKDHAVIMVKFARDCYSKMTHLLPSLAEKLGPDAASLAFRVGLHSGPVTGGVLRGQKSRFQLFGDTINTASRMETTGVAGRIHISQATADELTARGLGKWVTPREDKVAPKGKGQMQTYFVNIQTGAKSHVSTMTFVTNESTMSDKDTQQTSTLDESKFVAEENGSSGISTKLATSVEV